MAKNQALESVLLGAIAAHVRQTQLGHIVRLAAELKGKTVAEQLKKISQIRVDEPHRMIIEMNGTIVGHGYDFRFSSGTNQTTRELYAEDLAQAQQVSHKINVPQEYRHFWIYLELKE